MPSDTANANQAPSIFISYASADREAARLLSQTLVRAGLDAWLDEEELAGGEAWDAKIRRQIRTCTYFMPVISATTEARREGYFRREWRLAVERTLDLADDVTFLVPVVIDDTPEQGSRVPEKFTMVQWLRCPGGRETPALIAAAHRLANDNDSPANAPTRNSPPPLRTSSPPPQTPAKYRGPHPFPEFPAFPAAGRRARFIYDLVVWSGRTIRALWDRLPRWLRVLAMVMIVFKLIGVFTPSKPKKQSVDLDDNDFAESAANVKRVLSNLNPTAENESDRKILEAAGVALESLQSGRPLAMIMFGASDSAVQKDAARAFAALHSQLSGGGHTKQIAVGISPLPLDATDEAVIERSGSLKCHWLLTGVVKPADDGKFSLEVKLYDAVEKKLVWQNTTIAVPAVIDKIVVPLAGEIRQRVSFEGRKSSQDS
jgi:hypothetical protein